MKLEKLLDIEDVIKNNVDLGVEISSISSKSSESQEGAVFVALKGEVYNGNDFIEMALKTGAKCFITEDEEIYSKHKNGILVKDARSVLAKMWSNYFKNPDKDMKIIAITGTNGKTSTAFYLYKILEEAKVKCGLISTIEIRIGNRKIGTDFYPEISSDLT